MRFSRFGSDLLAAQTFANCASAWVFRIAATAALRVSGRASRWVQYEPASQNIGIVHAAVEDEHQAVVVEHSKFIRAGSRSSVPVSGSNSLQMSDFNHMGWGWCPGKDSNLHGCYTTGT